jgi:hypothetical protein
MTKAAKTMELPVPLTDSERKEKHEHLLKLLQERDQLESERNQINAGLKGRIKVIDADVEKTRLDLEHNRCMRDVTIREEVDRKKGTVEMFRADTGERIGERLVEKNDKDTKKVGA